MGGSRVRAHELGVPLRRGLVEIPVWKHRSSPVLCTALLGLFRTRLASPRPLLEMICIVGVDIDGVIGDHRKMFAEVLKRATGKQIDPEAITKIPVHQCRELEVTKDD